MNNAINGNSKIKENTSEKNNNTFVIMLKKLFVKQPVWVVLLVCIILFSILSPYFLTLMNITNILIQSSIIGFMAIGMTFILINGNIDLSVGSLMALVSAVVIILQPLGIFFSVTIGLLIGILIGILNGVIITKIGVNSFITTLAAMIGIRGLVYVVTKEQSVSGTNMKFNELGLMEIGFIPVVVIIFILLFLLGEWVLRKTSHGVNTFAIGGNKDAAKNAGIKVDRNIIINYAIIGAMCAISGIVLSSQINAATPTTGETYELWVIAAVVLGGTSLQGGVGGIFRTFGGVMVIGIIRNGMNLLGIDSYYVYVVMGLILIAVIFMDSRIQRNN